MLCNPSPLTDATAYSSAHFGQNTNIIIALDDIACTTAQSRLIDCTYDSNTADCGHSEDAGVACAAREFSFLELNFATIDQSYVAIISYCRMLSWQHQSEGWFYCFEWKSGGVSEWRLGHCVR